MYSPKGEFMRRKKPDTEPEASLLAMSISQFCAAHNILEAFYYKLKKAGQGPREMHLGSRTLITMEAAAIWRAEREAASAPEPASQAEKTERGRPMVNRGPGRPRKQQEMNP